MKIAETLAIENVLPGMHLAEAVLDEMGRTLMPAGCELSEGTLKALARREISVLTVVREVAEDPAEREAEQARILARINHLFRKAGDGVETRLLFQAIVDFRMEHR